MQDIRLLVDRLEVLRDCIDELGGHAYLDDCSDCVEGNTGLLPNYNDQDDDGVCNCGSGNGDCDNCPDDSNEDQWNYDGDEEGDVCDDDDDDDTIVDEDDSHPHDAFQCSDIDIYGIYLGDGCDDCSSGVFDLSNDGDDYDNDGVCDVNDSCYGGDDNYDSDGDGVANDCDVDIQLEELNSLVSFHALPQDASLDNLFSNQNCDIHAVIGQGIAGAFETTSENWVGGLNYIDCISGYWLKSNNIPCEYDFIGNEILSSPCLGYNMELSYILDEFANLISYPYSIPQPLDDYLCETGSIESIISQGTAAMCNDGSIVGSLADIGFTPGSGYWFKSDGSGYVFSYPEPSVDNLSRAKIRLPKVPQEFAYKQSMNQAFYFVDEIELEDDNIEIGDWLLVYNGDVIVGARMWNGKIIDIPVMGKDDEEYTSAYCETGSIPTFRVYKSQSGYMIELSSDNLPVWNNLGTEIVSLSQIQQPIEFTLAAAYPNPFNPITQINFIIPDETFTEISIIDLNGRIVDILLSENLSPGFHSIQWDASNHASGIYFVNMIAGEYVETQKLMLVK